MYPPPPMSRNCHVQEPIPAPLFFPQNWGLVTWLWWMQGSYDDGTVLGPGAQSEKVQIEYNYGRAQEPSPGSAAKHCWFLDTGRGGGCICLASLCLGGFGLALCNPRIQVCQHTYREGTSGAFRTGCGYTPNPFHLIPPCPSHTEQSSVQTSATPNGLGQSWGAQGLAWM